MRNEIYLDGLQRQVLFDFLEASAQWEIFRPRNGDSYWEIRPSKQVRKEHGKYPTLADPQQTPFALATVEEEKIMFNYHGHPELTPFHKLLEVIVLNSKIQ
ncbi:MAG: hypothetical protein ABH817_00570 [archaeon]